MNSLSMTQNEINETVLRGMGTEPRNHNELTEALALPRAAVVEALRWHLQRGYIVRSFTSWQVTTDGMLWLRSKDDPVDPKGLYADVAVSRERLAQAGILEDVEVFLRERGETLETVVGRRKTKNVSRARQDLYAALRKWPGKSFSYPDIQRLMGRLDHTSIIYGVRRSEKRGTQAA